jgi:hypothetical protein
MTFNEDRQLKRDKNAAENFAEAQKIALNLLKIENSTKGVSEQKTKSRMEQTVSIEITQFLIGLPCAIILYDL